MAWRHGACLVAAAMAAGPIPIVSSVTPARADDPAVPGAEHARLMGLEGDWDVRVDGEVSGHAEAVARLGGRFLELTIHADAGPVRDVIYTFGFDDRHDLFTVIAMDDSGTYWVTGRGRSEGDRITMYGKDDDPVMSSMGLEREFAITLDVESANEIGIETLLIDTRTRERRELPFLRFDMTRATAPDNAAKAADVRAAELAFARTMAERDLAAFGEHVAEEAVFIGGTVLRGRDSIRDGWSPYFAGEAAPFSWEPDVVEVVESGRLALSSGPVLAPGGARIGTFQSTWRLEPDGRWRVVFDKGCPPCHCGE